MAEPEDIVAFVSKHLTKDNTKLAAKHVVITAGPTFEALDPVRFIGNHSSGKMGICIAEEAAERGAKVSLILGPSKLSTNHPNVETIRIQSAQEMYEATVERYATADATVMAAAVADYRPKVVSTEKIKKKDGEMAIELERTKDIAAEVGKQKRSDQINIGFALETQNEMKNAQKKLIKKNFDFIVLNSLNDKGAGFKHDTNKITIVDRDNNIQEFELKSKQAVAADILDKIETYF